MICRAGKPFHQDLVAGYTLIAWDSQQPAALLTDLKTGELLAFESADSGKVADLELFGKYHHQAGKRLLIKSHTRSFLLPRQHHTPQKSAQSFKLLFDREAASFSHQPLLPIEAVMVWETEYEIEKNYDAVFDLQGVFLYQAAYEAMRSKEGICCFLWHKNRVYLSIFISGKLRFQNAFDCANTEELMYFLLSVCQHLNLSVADLRLFGAGQLENLDQELTDTYLGNIVALSGHTPRLTGMPASAETAFFPLLNAFLCA
jgi:hypothetical protein